MLHLHQLELNWIAAFQGNGGWTRFMTWCSYMGSEGLVPLAPFIYLVLSPRTGGRLLLLYLSSGCVSSILKVALHSPRPFWMDSRVHELGVSGGYGLPSGHALAAALVWPFLARIDGVARAWVVAILVVLLVSASRVYLGVHFISDVVAGWGIAIAFLLLDRWQERNSARVFGNFGLFHWLGVGLWASATLLAAGTAAQFSVSGISDPSSWAEFSRDARGLEGIYEGAGAFFGAACGLAMAARWARFGVSAPLRRRLLIFAGVAAGAWAVRKTVAHAAPASPSPNLKLTLAFVRGSALVWWTVFLAPWMLIRFRLLSAPSEPDSATLRSGA